MKRFILLGTLFLLNVSAENCNKKLPEGVYKAKLEVRGMCMNYTISLQEGKLDPALYEASWKDNTTGKEYKNVFRLGSPCNFPDSLKAGDIFYFTIDKGPEQDCPVCMAYYPTPEKSIRIKVVKP